MRLADDMVGIAATFGALCRGKLMDQAHVLALLLAALSLECSPVWAECRADWVPPTLDILYKHPRCAAC